MSGLVPDNKEPWAEGPWEYVRDRNAIMSKDRGLYLFSPTGGYETEQILATTRLATAAPELFTRLRELTEVLERAYGTEFKCQPGWLKSNRAFINKLLKE